MARRRAATLAVVAAVVLGVVAIVATDQADDDVPAVTTTTVRTSTIGAPGVGDPYFPMLGNGGYDVRHYDLVLTWLPDVGRLRGVATITAVATQDLTRFDLDLSGLEVRSVLVDGRPAGVARVDRELVITPADELDDEARFTTVVTYDGVPHTLSEGTNIFDEGWQTHGREVFVVSEPGGAQTFFPANDHPSDKATYTLRITAPNDQTVAANGLLQRKVVGGDTTTWTYAPRDPMASYLVQVAIGAFDLVDDGTVDGVVVRHALHHSTADEARTTVSRTGDMLRFLSTLWGPYPFEVYGVVAVAQELDYALETQTLTLVGSDLAGAGRGAEIPLVHEMAHQWVGDSVSPATWKDIWLNEGFATYAEWLWVEHEGGPSPAELARDLGPGLDQPPGDPGPDELFGAAVYQRGAAALQALREEVGDAAFFKILKAWPARHRFLVATTADFQDLAERLSGQELDALFRRWVYQPGQPTLG